MRVGGYREWADFLNDMKCGDPPPRRSEKWHEVQIGDRYGFYEFGQLIEVVTVTIDNKAEIEKSINDADNDICWYEREVF